MNGKVEPVDYQCDKCHVIVKSTVPLKFCICGGKMCTWSDKVLKKIIRATELGELLMIFCEE